MLRRSARALATSATGPFACCGPKLASSTSGGLGLGPKDADISCLLDNNAAWAKQQVEQDPTYFSALAGQQAPHYLWIGCSDSRVPANQIVGLPPGEVFVHRNIANVVVPSDLNCLSVLQFAVEHLRVRHIIVCGHYGCGGVKASLDQRRLGLVDNWLRHVRDVHSRHREGLSKLPNYEAKLDAMCELNALSQLRNVAKTTVIKDAWAGGNGVSLHAWVYGLGDGRVRPLLTLSRGSDNRTIGNAARKLLADKMPKGLHNGVDSA